MKQHLSRLVLAAYCGAMVFSLAACSSNSGAGVLPVTPNGASAARTVKDSGPPHP